mgnify:CR=1 FL=1
MLEAFFTWAEEQMQRAAFLPSNPMTKALHYALERRAGLSVYLDDPDVPIDTNHLFCRRTAPCQRPETPKKTRRKNPKKPLKKKSRKNAIKRKNNVRSHHAGSR